MCAQIKNTQKGLVNSLVDVLTTPEIIKAIAEVVGSMNLESFCSSSVDGCQK